MNYIILFLSICISLYTLFSLSIIIGWFNLRKITPNNKKPQRKIKFSILIPTRNEALNIVKLLKDIDQQLYNSDDYEIIVIDDSSQDNTYQLVEKVDLQNIKLVRSFGKGKKDALKTGLKIAKNEFIIQTDADCRIGNEWLSSINQYLNLYSVKLLIAPVIFESKNNLFSYLQELDFYALIMNTAGLAGIKHPVMANGANLIYRKELLNNINIWDNKSASGDDIFLLHYIKKNYTSKDIHFLKSRTATVKTNPNLKLKDFIQQRLRWASKSRYYKDLETIGLGLFIFIFYLSIFILFISGFFFGKEISLLFLTVFIVKIFIDTFVLFPILSFYRKVFLLIYFPILSILYPFYISFVALISPFYSIKWKNRVYKIKA